MGRKGKAKTLAILSGDKIMGHLLKRPTGAVEFSYASSWLESKKAFALSRGFPLGSGRFTGDKVWSFFDNLLPDNKDLRQIMAQKTKADSADAFDLLARIGRDCVGAVQLLPAGEKTAPARTLSYRPITPAKIEKILLNLAKAPLGVGVEDEFRLSIAGAQEKTALLRVGKKWAVPFGATPTSHIFKVAMGKLRNGVDMTHSVENEWLCMNLCEQFGMRVAGRVMVKFGGTRALVVGRFDREWRGQRLIRLPQEDLCQALGYPSSQKYEADNGPGIPEIMELLSESTDFKSDRRNFIKAQVLFWVMGASDGHAKNFSLFIGPQGQSLTPMYDILSAAPALAHKQIQPREFKMAMAVGKSRYYRMDRIHTRHWFETAQLCRFPKAEMISVLEEIKTKTAVAVNHLDMIVPKSPSPTISATIWEPIRTRVLAIASSI